MYLYNVVSSIIFLIKTEEKHRGYNKKLSFLKAIEDTISLFLKVIEDTTSKKYQILALAKIAMLYPLSLLI